MKYFSFQEFERSATAYRHGIDNTLPDKLKGNVAALVDKVLDPLREAWGKPITVTSGYRCAALNKAVGGSGTSHHLRGMAADISTGNKVENRRLFQLIIDLGLPFTQLIDEKGFSWVHVSLDQSDVKRQVLRL
ncbi:D-Ala-D-Ala carboxypeptidase family metallohydrolase [Paramuribaculum intestinale]|uniref:D-Ala-D-Ala carboxypeptidase family metallohydrolase n=1 Tax=Paramuribaculum intestinale TaxID=2094151 RepID=UPI0025A9FAB6|nr:D-Ala-D-Ala carboxypeptidase family metallohydrolase [Paramuribaculum intestinale]